MKYFYLLICPIVLFFSVRCSTQKSATSSLEAAVDTVVIMHEYADIWSPERFLQAATHASKLVLQSEEMKVLLQHTSCNSDTVKVMMTEIAYAMRRLTYEQKRFQHQADYKVNRKSMIRSLQMIISYLGHLISEEELQYDCRHVPYYIAQKNATETPSRFICYTPLFSLTFLQNSRTEHLFSFVKSSQRFRISSVVRNWLLRLWLSQHQLFRPRHSQIWSKNAKRESLLRSFS